ncbi:hypothetical protein ABI59_14900 [Acidobacteria bacterium Mor1]|nr:hypothetical protein ABI59_14900 [Acidobacteria bacterium Mor1]
MLARLEAGEHLAYDEAHRLLHALADEEIAGDAAGELLLALKAKGEHAEEVRGFAEAMLERARRPEIDPALRVLDVVGTGGDGSHSVNISTGSALLAAACGVPVLKHGNRSVSSKSGSADVLETLGFRLDLEPAAAGTCLGRSGFSFLMAPHYHPAMKALVPVRRALKTRTVFNMLGPLVNPARPPFLLTGAYSLEAARLMADTLAGMELERAFVIHGDPGWDEATPIGPYVMFDVRPGQVEERREDPADFGFARCSAEDLHGGDAAENADAMRRVFHGEQGAHRDALVLNVALALQLTGEVAGVADGVARANAAIDQGAAARLLQESAACSRELHASAGGAA